MAGFGLLPAVADANWLIVGTGDYNNDDRPDILWRRAPTGTNVVWTMNGVTPAALDFLPSVSDANWEIVAP